MESSLKPSIYYEADANIEKIRSKKVAIIEFGSQGHAHALNLKETGVDVTIGIRSGSSKQKAEGFGFKPVPVAEAVKKADLVMILHL